MPLRPMGREQMWMLRPTLDELLPLDHPARFVAEFVDALDRDAWAELGVDIEGDSMGAPAYHPRALLSVWLYGFMTGVRSCRKLEAACRDQIPYLWLTGWQHPDHNTLWRFYKGHRQAMRKLFERTVRTAVAMKLVDLAVQAVDGTKVVANASVNRSYDAEGLRGLLDRLERAITDLETQNEAGEEAAVARLPEKLADKEVLREQVKHAMADLASQKRHRRINLTDPEARLMKGQAGHRGWLQRPGYGLLLRQALLGTYLTPCAGFQWCHPESFHRGRRVWGGWAQSPRASSLTPPQILRLRAQNDIDKIICHRAQTAPCALPPFTLATLEPFDVAQGEILEESNVSGL